MAIETKKPPPPTVPAKTEPQKTGTQVAKRGEVQPAVPATPDLEQQMRDKMLSVTRADFFKVGGKKNDQGKWEDILEPSARVVQKWANDNHGHPICSRIVEARSDRDGVFVKVRGWIGEQDHPLVEKEEVVDVVFAHEVEFLLTEAVAKGIKTGNWVNNQPEIVKPPFNVEYDEATGVSRIVLTNPNHQIHILAEIARLKRFALRGAVTKAEKRIYKKLLGAEWRDEEEIEIEKDEVRLVAEEKGLQPGPAEPTPPPPPPVDTARLIPEAKKQEQKANGTVSPMAVTSLLTRFKDLGEKFPGGGDQFDHKEYLTAAAMGLMFQRGATINEAKLEIMTPEDSGKLWQMIGAISHGDEQALGTLDQLNADGKKVIAALNKRSSPMTSPFTRGANWRPGDHVSASQLIAWDMCSAKYWFDRVLRIPTMDRSFFLIGHELHKIAEIQLTNKRDKQPILSMTEIADRIRRDLEVRLAVPGVKFSTGETVEICIEDTICMAEVYMEAVFPKIEPLAIELPIGPEEGLRLPGTNTPVKAVIDVIDQYAGVRDLKTAKAKWPDGAAERKLQTNIYSWAFRALYQTPPAYVAYDLIVTEAERQEADDRRGRILRDQGPARSPPGVRCPPSHGGHRRPDEGRAILPEPLARVRRLSIPRVLQPAFH